MAGTHGKFDYKLFRKDWDNLLEQGKLEHYKEAEKLCHEGLAKSPEDQCRGRLYNHLGYLYENFLDDKTFDDILEHYVLSLQVDESNANSHYNLANFLLEQGMQHLLRSLELNPQHSKATKRFANLTPIKVNTTLDLGGHKYQVVEIEENGVRAVRLRRRSDGQYERTDDGNQYYIEVSSPEKVHPSSNKGRTNNVRQPMNIDDPHSDGNSPSNAVCCFRCVTRWWFWALLWILAVGGVVVPVLGYFNILEETECQTKLTASEVAVNGDSATQGDLNVLFVMDCGADDWDAQFVAADALLGHVQGNGGNSAVNVRYDVLQYCNTQATGYSGNTTVDEFEEYDSTFPTLTQESASGGDNSQLMGALSACADTFDTYSDGDSTPFLCVPFISQEFTDTFDAMEIAADSAFADIYLAFMVDEGDASWTSTVYSVLGSFATGTECINRLDSDDAYGNTWWDSQFNCDSSSDEQAYCQHCINYDNSGQLDCVGEDLNGLFSGQGVTETQVTGSEEECEHTYETIFYYCLAGVVPLLLWTCIAICVLCRQSRRRKRANSFGGTQQAYV